MRRLVVLGAAAALAALAPSCASGYGKLTNQARLVVMVSGSTGSPKNLLPLAFTPEAPLTVHIEARRPDDSIDTSFEGWVRITVKPGTVYSVSGTGAAGRNVQLKDGVADGIQVPIIASYGETHIWAEDIGYVPVLNLDRVPPPQCADGIDNNGNGFIDFPADPGCFAADDDTEDGGTFATGVSQTIYYQLPRIRDVRGATGGGSGSATAFPGEQVSVETGYDEISNIFNFDVVITRIASDGFYVTDVSDQATNGYASVFAYTFSTPTKLRVCDRLKSFSGTASDFFGFTEMGFPTWSVEYYDSAVRHCLVPEPTVLGIADLANVKGLFKVESALVRVQSDGPGCAATPATGVCVHVGKKLGSGFPTAPAYVPDPTHTNCDFNNNGKVDFSDPKEAGCSAACTGDIECSEFSGFVTQNQFNLVLFDNTTMASAKAEVDAASAPGFDPIVQAGVFLKAFAGTLRYFSGGTQFTIEARCGDDIVTDLTAQPVDHEIACVRPRTAIELTE